MLGNSIESRAAINSYYVGSQWRGLQQGAVGMRMLNVNVVQLRGTGAIGIVTTDGQNLVVQIEEGTGGIVTMRGLGQYSGFAIAGQVPAPPPGFGGPSAPITTGKFTARGVPALRDDAGSIGLVRLYPPDPYLPPDPYFPAGSSFGTFTSRSGFVGRAILEHNPPPSDHNPPDDRPSPLLTGKITFGDQVYQFVGTESNHPNADGSFNFDLICINTHLGAIIPCVRVAGRSAPLTERAPARVSGFYIMESSKGIMDQGSLELLPAV